MYSIECICHIIDVRSFARSIGNLTYCSNIGNQWSRRFVCDCVFGLFWLLAKIVSNENTLQLTLRLLKNKVPFTCLEDYLQLTEIQKHLNLVKSYALKMWFFASSLDSYRLTCPRIWSRCSWNFVSQKRCEIRKFKTNCIIVRFLNWVVCEWLITIWICIHLVEGAEKVLKDSLKEHGYDKISLGPFTHQLRFSGRLNVHCCFLI